MWVRKQDATAIFEMAYQEAAPEAPLPTYRQIGNYLMSGLPATRNMGREREYEKSSIQAVAATLASSGGRERLLHATPDGPWNALWRLHRAYSVDGVVVCANTAYVERRTGLGRRTIERQLAQGERPGSRIGYTWYVPLGAVRGPSGKGESPVEIAANALAEPGRIIPFGR